MPSYSWPYRHVCAMCADDAYVQLRSLELELRRLHLEGRRHLVYGAINLCAMPSTPDGLTGWGGSWLGRLENFKTGQAVRRSVAHLLRRRQEEARRRGEAGDLTSQIPTPFATGDLQVMDGELTRAVFGRCLYLKTFVKAGRRANRRSGCRKNGPDFASSWATTTCDWCAPQAPRVLCAVMTDHFSVHSAFGRVVAECATELGFRPTFAHMTQTKSHNYEVGAGYTTASAPSRLSIVVHALKFHDTWKSGPNHTRGGEWAHTHATAMHWRRKNEDDAGFPTMLWQFDPRARLNETILQPVDDRRQLWYSAACRPRRNTLRLRAEALVASVKGPRPSGSSDHSFLGGQVAHWTGHGCHPSRGYAYPAYPELALPPRDGDILPHTEYRVTSFNNLADGAVAFDWETRKG